MPMKSSTSHGRGHDLVFVIVLDEKHAVPRMSNLSQSRHEDLNDMLWPHIRSVWKAGDVPRHPFVLLIELLGVANLHPMYTLTNHD